jgi:uncharacterized protein with HEPN domain
MKQSKSDEAYLWDMLDAAKAVQDFIANKSVNDYLHNRMMRGAVERHVEIIGEAANRVSREYRLLHPEISWDKIIAQRHVLAHEYGEIKHELLWKVAREFLPYLIDSLSAILPEEYQS